MTEQAAAPQEQQGPQLNLARVFLKDASFEAPGAPDVFRKEWRPAVNLDMNTAQRALETGLYESVLTLTVTVKVENDTAFVVEIKQAGLFQITGLEQPMLQHALGAACPTILFPYAREAIDNLVVKGGFPPLVLPQPNFDLLFRQAVARQQQQAQQQQAPAAN